MLEAMLVSLLLVLLWPLWFALAVLAVSVVRAVLLFIAAAVGLCWPIFDYAAIARSVSALKDGTWSR